MHPTIRSSFIGTFWYSCIQKNSELIHINGYFKTKTNVRQEIAMQIVMQIENQNANVLTPDNQISELTSINGVRKLW